MLRDLAAKRYAQAAFQLARDRGELEVWERDLGALADTFASAEALAFVSSHQVRTEAK